MGDQQRMCLTLDMTLTLFRKLDTERNIKASGSHNVSNNAR